MTEAASCMSLPATGQASSTARRIEAAVKAVDSAIEAAVWAAPRLVLNAIPRAYARNCSAACQRRG